MERFARTPQVAKRLRRPEQPAGEAILVTRAAKLGDRVAVLRERALVVAANAMQQAAQEHDEREALLDPRRESVEPAPERRYLAGLEDALAVIADQLRRALVLAGLLQVSDRAIDVAPRQRALGVGAGWPDDGRRGRSPAGRGGREPGEGGREARTPAGPGPRRAGADCRDG